MRSSTIWCLPTAGFPHNTIFGTSPGMRFDTLVNTCRWQTAPGVPIQVWTSVMDKFRPYVSGDDAAALCRVAIDRIRPGRVVDLNTCNVTMREVLEAIRACSETPQLELIDSRIVNSLSFSSRTDDARALDFDFPGDLQTGVREMLAPLGQLEREHTLVGCSQSMRAFTEGNPCA